jgi:protoheme IX farnesyltransferase
MFKKYYQLAKPGIIYGNAITASAGFFLASRGHINWLLFAGMLVGIGLVMAAGCVFNNIWDRDIDGRMERTKNRALVTNAISKQNALVYGFVLGAIGFLVLYFYTNFLTTVIASVGFIFYIFIYTPIKRRSIYGTLLGAVAGAVPPVVGYTTVTDKLELGAWLLFAILVTWQLPHFYSIAIRRLDEYQLAGIPALPVSKGVVITKINIIICVILFIFATTLLTVFGFTGYAYLVVMDLFSLYWLMLAIRGFGVSDDKLWAKKMFFLSLQVLLVFSIMISIEGFYKV